MSRRTIIVQDYNYVLNEFSGAMVAYSLRKLRSAYAGFCIKVRNTTNNAEGNIAFNSQNIVASNSIITITAVGSSGYTIGQTMVFSAFYSTNTVVVVTWYDQSINGENMTQSSATSQPRIINNGSFQIVNNRPSIFIDGVNDYFVASIANFGSLVAMSLIIVDSPLVSQVADIIGLMRLSYGDSATRFFAFANNTGVLVGEKATFYWMDNTTVGRLASSTYVFNSGPLYLEWLNLTTSLTQLFKNGFTENLNLAAGITTTTDNTPSTTGFSQNSNVYIGGQFNNGNFITGAAGYISEWILYPVSRVSDRANIESNINQFYGIF